MIAKTQRILLREFGPDDLDDIHALMSDPQVMAFSLKGPYTREDSEAFLRRCRNSYRERGMGLWALVHREDSVLFGYCGFFFQVVDGVDEVELGYRLVPAYWHRGLASEAAAACRDLGFQQFGLPRLISLIEPANLPSARVAQRIGMYLAKRTQFKGVTADVYAIEKPGEPI